MAVIRRAPYGAGEVARLRPPKGSGARWVHVTRPDGAEFQVRASGSSPTAEVWLAQPGTWLVRWGQLPADEIVVSEDQAAGTAGIVPDPAVAASVPAPRPHRGLEAG